MKHIFIKGAAALSLGLALTSCGDKFLETEVFNGIDTETALDNVTNIGYAVNGTYYNLMYYYFAGNYATSIGDVASDISYWNGKTGHFDAIYQFKPEDTNTYLRCIWLYGYRVADNAARVISASDALESSLDEEGLDELNLYKAEAYALRAYAHLTLVNVFAHQVKVDGQDFSSQPGIVVLEEPKTISDKVERSSVGTAYASIVSDLKESLKCFDNTSYSRESMFYFSPASVSGLLARTLLYMEEYDEAASYAQDALDLSGISSLVDTPADYRALYMGGDSNIESMFALAIDTQTNWSANSCGTLWSTYNYSPSPWLQSVMATGDCRRAVWAWHQQSSPEVPVFMSGKFSAYGLGGNPANATNYLINAPEMFLIRAEAAIHDHDVAGAQAARLAVAKRNPAITSTADLPSDTDALFSFLKEERARELFQEGHRLWDLRRWGGKVSVSPIGAPAVAFSYTGYEIGNLVFPIPVDEINTGAGVTQTEGWRATLPSK